MWYCVMLVTVLCFSRLSWKILSCVLDDHSRVVLHSSDNPDSDYINANYIDVSNLKRAHSGILILRYLTLEVLSFLSEIYSISHTHTHTTVVWPFFRDHPGEPVPEENFWILWCKGRLTEADTPTIWLGATPPGLNSAHLHHRYGDGALHTETVQVTPLRRTLASFP